MNINIKEKEIKKHDVEKLEAFFQEIANLTLHHDVIDDYAVVYTSRLGSALEKVDFDWAVGSTLDIR
jgi:hypothetical protein